MPIKYNDYREKDDYVGNVPIAEQILANDNTSAMNDMLSNIISEKQKMDNTSVIKMMGALTPVTYYHTIGSQNGSTIASDANGPSDIGNDTKKFQKIKKFLIKLESGVNLEQPENESDKDYSATGSLIILPRTIKPVEGDMFIMEYYNKTYCWFITSVEISTFESEQGFKCGFAIYKKDYIVPESQVTETYVYHHEFVGTTYRPILTPEEYEILTHGGELYKHLSDVFNDLFYDKTINGYIFKEYDYEKSNKHIKDNININTLGSRGGLFRASYDGDVYNMTKYPVHVEDEAMAYDNFLNEFIAKNRIFRKYEGIYITTEPMLAIDRVCYKRSVYNCIEARSVAHFKNIFVSPISVQELQQGLPSYFVGKKNVLYHDGKNLIPGSTPFNNADFFPQTLTDSIINGKNADMSIKCTGIVYASIDNFIIETIVRFIYDKTDDFVDRIKYLYENIDNLYEHNISYNRIYYLFPLLGFVIEHSLQKLYSDNIVE